MTAEPSRAFPLGDETLPDRPLAAADPTDVRFQYEVIRQLAESVRQQTQSLARMQEQMGAMAERMARIEANRVHDDVERLRVGLDEQTKRVDALMRDKDRRDGALGAAEWLRQSAPWAWLIAVGSAAVAWFKTH